tara:strand:- start:6133 stop:6321 length:189 start_codon:yes stop_codon:yes gene_type:complete
MVGDLDEEYLKDAIEDVLEVMDILHKEIQKLKKMAVKNAELMEDMIKNVAKYEDNNENNMFQ